MTADEFAVKVLAALWELSLDSHHTDESELRPLVERAARKIGYVLLESAQGTVIQPKEGSE